MTNLVLLLVNMVKLQQGSKYIVFLHQFIGIVYDSLFYVNSHLNKSGSGHTRLKTW